MVFGEALIHHLGMVLCRPFSGGSGRLLLHLLPQETAGAIPADDTLPSIRVQHHAGTELLLSIL